MSPSRVRSALLLVLALLAGCATESAPAGAPSAAAHPVRSRGRHVGPSVVMGPEGPARYAGALYAAFDPQRAMDTVRFVDRYYRAPAGDGYEASLDYLAAQLGRAGFGTKTRFELRVVETPMDHPAWTPIRARLSMFDGSEEVLLHGFEKSSDRDRCMLPENAPSAHVDGEVVFGLHEVAPGKILVVETRLKPDILNRAKEHGAVAVFSKYLRSFNVDPTGERRHMDAILYESGLDEVPLPVAQISPRAYERLAEVYVREGTVRVRFDAEVSFTERPLRTLIAAIRGTDRADEAVATVAHLQEPGACDNGSGIAGLMEGARVLARLLDDGELDWPSRTLVFVWGDEMAQSTVWMEHTDRRPILGISSDMTGQSRARTGAMPLLERCPDPGAVVVMEPDVHTPWGANYVDPDSLIPNGLNVVARCALADVAAICDTPWETREHPWEGGSDHDKFIERGLPGVLFWHFTDFAYHTSLDRLEHVDPESMRRMTAAVLSTALAMADPREEDLDRYLRSVKLEEDLRVTAAEREGDQEMAAMWRTWCRGARDWLRSECLRLPVEHAAATDPDAEGGTDR